MIRLLQKDNRIMKIIFAVIIGLAAITMVITLVPGIFDNASASDSSVYATVREPGFFGRTIGDSTQIKTVEVNQLASRQLQQQHLPEQLMPYLVRARLNPGAAGDPEARGRQDESAGER
jgi:peptidyl-prolyl cis-trans isomerase D